MVSCLARTPPKSLKKICREVGLPLDGHTRDAISSFLDAALFNLWEAACVKHGGEFAACLMWQVVLCDPRFAVPHWLACRFRAHSRAILQLPR